MTGIVYVVKGRFDGLVKIGKTVQPKQRFAALRTSYFGPIVVLYTQKEADPGRVERGAHKMLKGHCHVSEWFKVSPEEAIEAVKIAGKLAAEFARTAPTWIRVNGVCMKVPADQVPFMLGTPPFEPR